MATTERVPRLPTFNDIEDVATIEFPAKDPSTGQLATRIDRAVPRLDTATTQAKDDAGSARTLALLGLAVGVLGVAVGAGALATARRTAGGGHDGSVKPGRKPSADQREPLSR